MTAAIYARYSTDLQSERSIEDQVRACRSAADRVGLPAAALIFEDRATSGASMANRPGLGELLLAVERRAITAVIVESLDRLSRDQADLALIYRALKLQDVRLVTVSEGEIRYDTAGMMTVGLRAIVGSIYLADLADKTRRGLMGVAADGRIPGGLCYGYRAGANPGEREIHEGEAEILRRIFTDYADNNLSPRAIAAALNAEGVPGPRGGEWQASAIKGNPKRLNGILHNRLYVGELVFNRQRKVKDPATGKARMRPNPESEWKRFPVPELAILDEELWNRAQARLDAMRLTQPEHNRRPKRPFSGLIKCGQCGGSYVIVAKDRYGCSHHRDRGTCSNGHTIKAVEIEERVLTAVREHLLSPEAVKVAVEQFQRRAREAARDARQGEARLLSEIAGSERRIARLVDAIAEGLASPAVSTKLAAEEVRLAELQAQRAPESAPVIALHPGAPEAFARVVEGLHGLLQRKSGTDGAVARAIEKMRELIIDIVITPAKPKQRIDVRGTLAALLGEEGGAAQLAVGAGTGFEPVTFRL